MAEAVALTQGPEQGPLVAAAASLGMSQVHHHLLQEPAKELGPGVGMIGVLPKEQHVLPLAAEAEPEPGLGPAQAPQAGESPQRAEVQQPADLRGQASTAVAASWELLLAAAAAAGGLLLATLQTSRPHVWGAAADASLLPLAG